MSDTSCGFLNNSLSIKTVDGKISQCCTMPPKKANNIDLSPSIFVEPLSGMNSPEFVELRRALNSGVKHPGCNKCWKIEENNGYSYRNIGNKYITQYMKEDNITITSNDYISYNDLYWLDINLGNKCNLGCRMCSPHSSSLLAKQLSSKNKPSEIELVDKTKNKIYDIITNSPNLKHIHLVGGEPLFIDFHDELCEYLISINRAKDIELILSTNLQIDFTKKIELHQNFKKIAMSVSIDGIGDTYEYIRWPGNWDKLKNNLLLLTDPNLTKYQCGISMVLQNLVVDNLYDSITTLQQLPNINTTNIYFHPVLDKNYTHILPTKIIEAELEKLDGLKNIDGLKQSLREAIELSKTLKLHEVMTFFKQQKLFDGLRNQNLFTIKPHFLELAEQFNIEPW